MFNTSDKYKLQRLLIKKVNKIMAKLKFYMYKIDKNTIGIKKWYLIYLFLLTSCCLFKGNGNKTANNKTDKGKRQVL